MGIESEILDLRRRIEVSELVSEDLSERISVLEESAQPAPSEPPKPTPEPGRYDGVWQQKKQSCFFIIRGKTVVYVCPSDIHIGTIMKEIDDGTLKAVELTPEIANALAGAGSGLGSHPADVEAARQKVIEAAKAVYLNGFDITTVPHWTIVKQAFIDAVQKLYLAEQVEAAK